MLYGTGPLDPAVFLTVIAILLLVAAIACLIPAWRASRLDPMSHSEQNKTRKLTEVCPGRRHARCDCFYSNRDLATIHSACRVS